MRHYSANNTIRSCGRGAQSDEAQMTWRNQ